MAEDNQRQTLRLNVPKPYRLDGREINRDKLESWWNTLLTWLRQDNRYQKYLPAGRRRQWTALDRDETRGITVAVPDDADQAAIEAAEEEEDRLRNDLEDLLNTVGTYSPDGMYYTIRHEATSLKWVLNTVRTTFNLDTKGENFVMGSSFTFDKEGGETYQLFYQRLRSFYMETLLPAQSTFNGELQQTAEAISPLAEQFIVEKWLAKIDPRLPNHVRMTKGFLFSPEKPTIKCVQKQLCTMIDTMLVELDPETNASRATAQRIALTGTTFQQNQYQRRGRGQQSNRGQRRNNGCRGSGGQQVRFKRECSKCLEAGRHEQAKEHDLAFCPHLTELDRSSFSRVRYVTVPVEDDTGDFQLEDTDLLLNDQDQHFEDL